MIIDERGVRCRESHEDHPLGEKCVRERAEKGYYVLAFCSWLMSFSEFMYGKMRCTYMTSCAATGGEVLFGKMRHRQQRCGRGTVKMSYLHEAMRLVGMWHAKMRQRGPVVQSDMWKCCCVQVLVYEALQLKRVTIEGSGELYHKGRRRARRQGGKVVICVSRRGDQASTHSGMMTS
jgi:hypothetical protein